MSSHFHSHSLRQSLSPAMAVDVCPDFSCSSLVVSPRISFSHDLRDSDLPSSNHVIINRSDALLLESIDFNFCISPEILSSADELFADGKILPAVVKKSAAGGDLRSKPISPHLRSKPVYVNPVVITEKKKSLKEFLDSDAETEHGEDKAPAPAPAPAKPFWQFRRSSSLNFDHYKSNNNNTLLRSLHFLSRSYSTGSAPNPKTPSSSSSTSVHPNIMRKSASSSSSSSTRTYQSSSYKRTPSRKSYGNGVRIIPVLNIPHACGTVNLFGLGSLFCNGKSKKKKKCNY